MGTGATRRVVDWGHLGFLAFIAVVVLTYLFDARAVSLKTDNLLLVQPAAIIALILIACVLPQIIKRRAVTGDVETASDNSLETADPVVDQSPSRHRRDFLKVLALATLLGIFCFFLETIGFDLATFLFVAVGLVLCGERKWWVVLLFSAAFTLFVVYGYSTLVPYPFPMRIL